MLSERDPVGCDLGIVGLGVMGRNLLLNMADHGYSVVGYDKDPKQVDALRSEASHRSLYGETEVTKFIGRLRRPRVVLILVPAGAAVESVLNDFAERLQADDILIDAGNSYFKDTDARAERLAKRGIPFLGIGISGGEYGARHGPSIMPGGPHAAYARVGPIFEAIAATANDTACVTYLGKGSASHFVKMVHNGIEYALMQLIAETYDLLKRGLGLDNDELKNVYGEWNCGATAGYLVEITQKIFGRIDSRTGSRLVDQIASIAKQKGTGMWTTITAMELHVPVPTIDMAVAARDTSLFTLEHHQASGIYQRPIPKLTGDRDTLLTQLERALYAAMTIAYAQGLALLGVASNRFDYGLSLESVCRIWRGGCIIRSTLLDDIGEAFRVDSSLVNLLLAPNVSKHMIDAQSYLRQVVSLACELGLPVPALMSALSYFDAYRSEWLPTNLIQAQRDCFGAHGYQRIDTQGTFHTDWDAP